MSILSLSAYERVVLEDALLLAQDKLFDLAEDVRFSKNTRNSALTKRSQIERLYDRVANLDPTKRTAFDVIGNDDHEYHGIACRSVN